MKRLTAGCSARALLRVALFSLVALSQSAPTAWAQNRLRYPVVRPVREAAATDAPSLIPAEDQNTVHFTAPSLAPALTTPAPAAAPVAASAPAAATVASALDEGRSLETQHRWGEAYALYEDVARQTY